MFFIELEKIDKETFRFPIEWDNNPIIENKIHNIVNIYAKNGVYISVGNNGFEEDLLEFIGSDKIHADDLDYLKEAKLKNLHKYLLENNIDISITEKNKESVLLRFMKNEY